MSATGRRRPRAAGDRGATLLEMLVVVAILGLVAGIGFTNLHRSLGAATLLRARADLASNLQTARADAARDGHAVTVERADDGGSYDADGRRVTLAAPLGVRGEPRSIQFFADGSSSGGRWTVASGRRELAVAVDPVTGVATATGVE